MSSMPARSADIEALRRRWEAMWPAALEAWSRFTRLRPPTLCVSVAAARREGLSGSFAMIRLADQAVVVSLPDVVATGVEDYALEVLAHEIGHHVLAPATLTDHARTIARMRWSLPTVEARAPMIANLYTDLLINDRLQRSAGLQLADVYRTIGRRAGSGGSLWAVYMRIYEILWILERGSLGGGPTDDRMEGDAWLGARLVRSYARDWLDGSGRFAALMLPYLLDDETSQEVLAKLFDTRDAAMDGEVPGLADEDPGERTGAVHPAEEGELAEDAEVGEEIEPKETPAPTAQRGQARQPFEYGEILRGAGLALDDHEVAVRYYRERAMPYLVPFPSIRSPEGHEPLPEGLEPWDIGQPLDEIDWLQSVLESPLVVPGMTTVRRLYGTTEGALPEREPLDLDLYVDSSGSMVDPRRLVSYPALAGAILALSALRAGARVQATLWSGKHQVAGTPGFVRDERAVLRTLTGYFGGGTAFPIHRLRDTYADRQRQQRPTHILVVSDDGASTMFDHDERGASGWEVAREALDRAQGGGTLVLELPEDWERVPAGGYYGAACADIRRARDELGWHVYRVASWENLVSFAREFSRRRYGPEEASGG